jgi:Xaa-Pro aminopeptidase
MSAMIILVANDVYDLQLPKSPLDAELIETASQFIDAVVQQTQEEDFKALQRTCKEIQWNIQRKQWNYSATPSDDGVLSGSSYMAERF